MFAFSKSIRNADHVRRYSIRTSPTGWDVLEEEDSRVIRQGSYTDWHRVERVRRSFVLELTDLQQKGWRMES